MWGERGGTRDWDKGQTSYPPLKQIQNLHARLFKSEVFRVTTVSEWRCAVAAIWLSSEGTVILEDELPREIQAADFPRVVAKAMFSTS